MVAAYPQSLVPVHPLSRQTWWRVAAQVLLSEKDIQPKTRLIKAIHQGLPKAVPEFELCSSSRPRRHSLTVPVCLGLEKVDEVEMLFHHDKEGLPHRDLSRRFLDAMAKQIEDGAPESLVFFAMVRVSHSSIYVETDVRVGWYLPASMRAEMEIQVCWAGDSGVSVFGSGLPRDKLTPALWNSALRPARAHMNMAKAALGGHLCAQVCQQVLPFIRVHRANRHLEHVLPSNTGEAISVVRSRL